MYWILILAKGKFHWFSGDSFGVVFDEAHAAFPDDNTHIFVFISDGHSAKELTLVKEL